MIIAVAGQSVTFLVVVSLFSVQLPGSLPSYSFHRPDTLPSAHKQGQHAYLTSMHPQNTTMHA